MRHVLEYPEWSGFKLEIVKAPNSALLPPDRIGIGTSEWTLDIGFHPQDNELVLMARYPGIS
ncbi:hypothetical protein CIHG_01433 [Coccidioides immitis H538.4]|uniref:Uncharacterized protein n=3 Tax=Coccidioides immitis TaxID=5501 RepID=A0A0J8QP63_COCIT|nr:hypothetical protein CIRG_01286 [Coccidioides immitis RMSCC 2394]KMU74271.1 hypothetical protein CISG_04620 [Coccidioides immitis RMSCC 3703]KMU83650.1 hypothetical protein CIHG_01433 [Coccidioides immitis H538.4]